MTNNENDFYDAEIEYFKYVLELLSKAMPEEYAVKWANLITSDPSCEETEKAVNKNKENLFEDFFKEMEKVKNV